MNADVVKSSGSGVKVRGASGTLHHSASESKGRPSATFNSPAASTRKIAKYLFSADEIIRCFDSCISGSERPGAALELEHNVVAKTQSGHGSVDTKNFIKSASIATADKTITAAAAALANLSSKPPKKKRHIHRRSIVGRGNDGSFTKASFHHHRRSSMTMTLNKMFTPKLSSGMCTVPGCPDSGHSSARESSHMIIGSRERSASATPLHRPGSSLPVQPRGALYLKPYLLGFRELCKLLRQLGNTLSFVIDNLEKVLNTMDFHLRSDRASHYEHVEMMLKYETTYKLALRKISGRDSGTKSLLLLHRSQSFLLELIRGLRNAGPRMKTSAVAQQAFDNTISKHFSWLVNSMASMAFSSLPPVQECLGRIGNGETKQASADLKRILDAITPVYLRIQDLYSKYRQLKCA